VATIKCDKEHIHLITGGGELRGRLARWKMPSPGFDRHSQFCTPIAKLQSDPLTQGPLDKLPEDSSVPTVAATGSNKSPSPAGPRLARKDGAWDSRSLSLGGAR